LLKGRVFFARFRFPVHRARPPRNLPGYRPTANNNQQPPAGGEVVVAVRGGAVAGGNCGEGARCAPPPLMYPASFLLDLLNFLTSPAVFRVGRKVWADAAAQQRDEV